MGRLGRFAQMRGASCICSESKTPVRGKVLEVTTGALSVRYIISTQMKVHRL